MNIAKLMSLFQKCKNEEREIVRKQQSKLGKEACGKSRLLRA